MQSDVVFGFIFVAFIFYITAKGELATYLDILRGGGKQPANANSGTSNSLEAGDALNNTLSDVADAAAPSDSASILTNSGLTYSQGSQLMSLIGGNPVIAGP